MSEEKKENNNWNNVSEKVKNIDNEEIINKDYINKISDEAGIKDAGSKNGVGDDSKEVKEKISENEKRIRGITRLYYSNPKVQEVMLKFAQDREVSPRYFEGFGKRPDALQYPSDIIGLVNKGATSFHCSIEYWKDPLKISSEMQQEELNELRKGWDLLIDIDTPYFDLSKLAAKLVLKALEFHGVKNYKIKFSGSKGFHVIVSWRAFPEEFNGLETRKMYPEFPRAITEYLFNFIEQDFMEEAGKLMTFGKEDKNKEKEIYMKCLNCGRNAKKGILILYKCPVCGMEAERKDAKQNKRKLRCLKENCSGFFENIDEKEYYFCEYCKNPGNEKQPLDSIKNDEMFKEVRGEKVSEHAKFDLVLVAPRHLFRMPYSLHEKTALASVVLTKDELEKFNPRDANPLHVSFREFMPKNEEGEARKLLNSALEWKKKRIGEEEKKESERYRNYKGNQNNKDRKFEEINFKEIREEHFPVPIRKLLKGIKDGRKRGLFILITFFKSLNFPPDYINNRVREWNKLNAIPLKEGYVKSQIEWHLKQRKKILPPNYNNDSFYKDLGLLEGEKKPETKNPVVDVMRNVRKRK